jgi:hypothetical protein
MIGSMVGTGKPSIREATVGVDMMDVCWVLGIGDLAVWRCFCGKSGGV